MLYSVFSNFTDMATLYTSAKTARRVVFAFLILGIMVAALNLISYVPATTNTVSTASYYMAATAGFGRIPAPNVSALQINSSVTPKYSIEGVYTLSVPDSYVSYVYKVEEPVRTLTEIQEAKKVAATLGFTDSQFKTEATTTAQACAQSICEWETADQSQNLTYNILSKEWELKTDFLSNPDAKSAISGFLDLEQYTDNATRLLNSLGFNQFGMNNSTVKGQLVELNSNNEFSLNSTGRYALIDIQRVLRFSDIRDRDGWPKIASGTAHPNFSAIDARVYGSSVRRAQAKIIAGNGLTNFSRDVFEFSFTNIAPELTSGSVTRAGYLIIRPSEAWTKVQTGEGILVDLEVPGDTPFVSPQQNLAVREFIADAFKTELAYYQSDEWTGYITPIYIFRGGAILTDGSKANFTYYVDAIKRL